MYDILYSLIKYSKTDTFYRSSCSYDNTCNEYKIKSQLILSTFDKNEIYSYFSGNDIPDDYQIGEYKIENYENFYKYSDMYIIFYNNFTDNLTSDNNINIVNMIFGYEEMIDYLKEHNLFTVLKCDIKKVNKLLYDYQITKIDIRFTDFIYTIGYEVFSEFSELNDCPRMEFLYLNNVKIPFPDEELEEFNERVELYNECERQMIIIKEETERLKIENKELHEKIHEKNTKRDERINKFLQLSIEKQEEILNSYH